MFLTVRQKMDILRLLEKMTLRQKLDYFSQFTYDFKKCLNSTLQAANLRQKTDCSEYL